jgi:hypothetical protein
LNRTNLDLDPEGVSQVDEFINEVPNLGLEYDEVPEIEDDHMVGFDELDEGNDK